MHHSELVSAPGHGPCVHHRKAARKYGHGCRTHTASIGDAVHSTVPYLYRTVEAAGAPVGRVIAAPRKIYDDWSVHVELYAQMTTRLCCRAARCVPTIKLCAGARKLNFCTARYLTIRSSRTYSAVHSYPGYAYAVELPESASLVRTGQALHKPCCCSSQPRTCQLSVSCVSSSDLVNCSPVNNWNCCFLLVDQRPSCYSTLACVPEELRSCHCLLKNLCHGAPA